MLHDRFAKLVASAAMPDDAEDVEPADTDAWELDSFPGIEAATEEPSDPASEGVTSDIADGSFSGVVEPSAEGALLRRSLRIARDDI